MHHYVQSCHACIRSKARRSLQFGDLKPLPIGQRPWSSISNDHIVQLLKAGKEQYNAILVVVDQLMKQAIYIPCHTTDTARNFARLFLENVFSKHGLPADIVSDHGSLFISQFWKELCKILGIESQLSTTYHPQTDGQTERTNQSLKGYLRIYMSYDQDDWDSLLRIAEFVYNNMPYSVTGLTPFFANKGYHPFINIDIAKLEGTKTLETAQDWITLNKYLKERLQQSFDRAALYYDNGKRPTPKWKVGDTVYLNAKNIKTK